MATIAQFLAETWRLGLMRGLEDLLRGAGYGLLAGVDEAGRGSLAGPVVAAAVLVEPDRVVPGVDDSKSVSAEKRSRLADAIRSVHRRWSVVSISPQEVDRTNILEATRTAMTSAIHSLEPTPDLVLVDAVRLSSVDVPTLPVIRGDQVSYAIACASILAKVERDAMMVSLDREYPHYGFAQHKGYGAARHRQALSDFGPSPVHRLTFRSVLPRTPRERLKGEETS